MVFVLKNIDKIFMKNTDPVFVLKNTDKTFLKNTDLVFVLKNTNLTFKSRKEWNFCDRFSCRSKILREI